jgi:hypothetical protein
MTPDIQPPPGSAFAMQRKIWIPNYPHDPSKGGTEFDIDLRPLFNLRDDTILRIQETVSSWYFCMRYYTWLSRQVMLNTKRIVIQQLTMKYPKKSKVDIVELMLPHQYHYVYWQQQYEWCSAATQAISSSLIPLVRTYSADKRAEVGGVF